MCEPHHLKRQWKLANKHSTINRIGPGSIPINMKATLNWHRNAISSLAVMWYPKACSTPPPPCPIQSYMAKASGRASQVLSQPHFHRLSQTQCKVSQPCCGWYLLKNGPFGVTKEISSPISKILRYAALLFQFSWSYLWLTLGKLAPWTTRIWRPVTVTEVVRLVCEGSIPTSIVLCL